jgi:hypothetical protein
MLILEDNILLIELQIQCNPSQDPKLTSTKKLPQRKIICNSCRIARGSAKSILQKKNQEDNSYFPISKFTESKNQGDVNG